MKNFKLLLIIIATALSGILSGCGILGDTLDEQPADISLNELENRMLKAMDPDGVYSKADSYVQKQMQEVKKGFSEEKSYIVEVKFKRPDMFVMTTLEDNQRMNSVIFNGSKAWMADFRKRKVTEITGVQFEKLKVIFGLGQPGNTYQKLFAQVKLTQCSINEQEYYRLECISKIEGQYPFIIYVGKNNFMTKRLETQELIGGSVEQYTSIIDKYKLYEGVMIPAETTAIIGNSEQKFNVIYYKLNAKIHDSEFVPPNFPE